MSDTSPLADQPFAYRHTNRGLVRISYRGKVVTTLSGKHAAKFLSRVEGADAMTQQMAMAKVTGHFKHGNENDAKQGPKA